MQSSVWKNERLGGGEGRSSCYLSTSLASCEIVALAVVVGGQRAKGHTTKSEMMKG